MHINLIQSCLNIGGLNRHDTTQFVSLPLKRVAHLLDIYSFLEYFDFTNQLLVMFWSRVLKLSSFFKNCFIGHE